nr:lysoplasmalogenase [Syntrophales bacterium]
MENVIIIGAAVLLLIVLLYHIREDNQGKALVVKAALSSLFVIAVLVQPYQMSGYYYLILAGLIFCLCGDVALALPQKGMFLAGLVAFLIGHVLYIVGFLRVTGIGQWAGVGSLVIAATGVLVYFWLRAYLGRMKVPVICYMIVISVMLAGAWSIFNDHSLARSGRIMIFTGALLFYLSDLF